ncbi:type II secretion system protein [Pelagicoccus sp. SDUM812002]|uniref:type II secretion system protein n=1 Tax=Pelagicoccus sp. SDUM812002 TaxID=3041266 RepID=UPI00280CC57D|nr:type II secretion system protein [Pelagicoccus sp. SDUM812002]MDQ8186465.1 type II secretion system protein [Pelagicoccus sp. SDUM812002]
MNKAKNSRKGFTLIELLIAVVILGVLASIAVPLFSNYVRNARAASFASDIRILASAGSQYALESGWWVQDSASGVFPPELEGYVSKKKFELGSPLGGKWDYEQDGVGDFTSAVGVHAPTHGDEIFAVVDKRIDDGDLTTGLFQKIDSDRFYYVIEE